MRIYKGFAIMNRDSLPHLTKLSNENGYVLPGGSQMVFKFKEVPERPQKMMTINVIIDEEKTYKNNSIRYVIRIRKSDKSIEGLPYLKICELPKGRVIHKSDLFVCLLTR